MTPVEARLKAGAVVGALVEPIVQVVQPMDAASREAFWLGFLHSIRGCVAADLSPKGAAKIFAEVAAGAARTAKAKKVN